MSNEMEPKIMMQLGNFSLSLAVKDLAVSRTFYEKLGFSEVGGVAAENWLILQNGTTTIGLFQGMFENNTMTFNPGWNHKMEVLDDFNDVREIQSTLQDQGVELLKPCEPEGNQPDSIMIADPDGNMILIDQHVAG